MLTNIKKSTLKGIEHVNNKFIEGTIVGFNIKTVKVKKINKIVKFPGTNTHYMISGKKIVLPIIIKQWALFLHVKTDDNTQYDLVFPLYKEFTSTMNHGMDDRLNRAIDYTVKLEVDKRIGIGCKQFPINTILDHLRIDELVQLYNLKVGLVKKYEKDHIFAVGLVNNFKSLVTYPKWFEVHNN